MRKLAKSAVVIGIASIALLGSCNGEKNNSSKPTVKPTTSTHNGGDFTVAFKGEEFASGESANITLTVNEGVAILVPTLNGEDSTSAADFNFASDHPEIVDVNTNTGHLSPKSVGKAVITVTYAKDAAKKLTINVDVVASTVSKGLEDLTAVKTKSGKVDYEEKARILATLEKYAVDNYLTGITLFSNGSRVLYNDRYKPLPTSYVTGYGWGTMREGRLTADLPNALGGHPDYYTIGTTSLPSHANAMNASGSDVSTVYNLIANSYYETRLNATNDGYEWYPKLAKDNRPIPIDEEGNTIASTDARFNRNKRWRIHVKTGNQYTYRTASTKTKDGTAISSFNNRPIALEDYITPLKLMLTNWNGQYRGSELTDGISGFKGAAAYFTATSDNKTGDNKAIYDAAAWDRYMGNATGHLVDSNGQVTNKRGNILVGTDDAGDYIEFNLLQPCTQFFAMYYLHSSLYSPLPESFIRLWNPSKELGKSPDGFSEVDTMLSSGPYFIQNWESVGKTGISFQKNDTYFYKQDEDGDFAASPRKVYQLHGVQYNSVQQTSVLKSDFLNGNIDSYGPNKDDLKGDMKNMTGTGTGMTWTAYQTKGDSNFKLNVNASTSEQWKRRFGKTGSIHQHSSDSPTDGSYSSVKPYMSNIHFLNFLSYALDRETICAARGMTPTQEYFSDNYIINPETGTSYNSTAAHKAVVSERFNSTYGFNKEAAKSELKMAIDEVLSKMNLSTGADGTGAPGTKTNPYLVPLDMFWMNVSDLTDYSDVFDSIKSIFGEVSQSRRYNGAYKLDIHMPTPSADYNAVYDRMREGNFDLGFGAVSGNSLDPLNFLEVLKSDNSSGFTLNWGPDTDKVSPDIVYGGKTWSFDSLWKAANTGVVLTDKGDIANVQNVSSKNTAGLFKYEERSSDSASVTYKVSFQQLISAGAHIQEISLIASDKTKNFVLNGESGEAVSLNIDASTNWTGLITVGKEFNRVLNKKTGEESDNNLVTLKVTYTATDSEGTEHDFTTSLSLLTYHGVMGS